MDSFKAVSASSRRRPRSPSQARLLQRSEAMGKEDHSLCKLFHKQKTAKGTKDLHEKGYGWFPGCLPCKSMTKQELEVWHADTGGQFRPKPPGQQPKPKSGAKKTVVSKKWCCDYSCEFCPFCP